jgi:hypothetical protein
MRFDLATFVADCLADRMLAEVRASSYLCESN